MKYSKARAEVVLFDNSDVITTSPPPCDSFGSSWEIGGESGGCNSVNGTHPSCPIRNFWN